MRETLCLISSCNLGAQPIAFAPPMDAGALGEFSRSRRACLACAKTFGQSRLLAFSGSAGCFGRLAQRAALKLDGQLMELSCFAMTILFFQLWTCASVLLSLS